jgi:hypothetical protein
LIFQHLSKQVHTMTSIDPNYLPKTFYDNSGNLLVSQDEALKVSQGIAERVKSMPEAQREVFLSMLRGAQLTPEGGLPPGNMNEVLDRMEAASLALVRLAELKGGMIDLLARVMIEQAGEQRKNELENRLAAREMAKSELLEQAGKLTEAAQKMLDGAIAMLVVSIVVAVATVVMSGIQMGKAGKQLEMAKGAKGLEGDDLRLALDTAGGVGAQAQVWGAMAQAIGALGGAVGNMAKTGYDAEAKRLEAAGSVDAAEAQYAQQQGDLRKEMQDTLNQMIQAIINFIKEMKEAEVNMMQSITRG